MVKVGGSLFNCGDLPETLQSWLAGQPAARNILVAGGGALADFVRDADRRFHLTPAASHWLCVRLLEATGDLLAQLLPGAVRLTRFDELQARLTEGRSAENGSAMALVFTAEQFLREHEVHLPGSPVAQDWRTTSDAIAARVARAVGAAELVLLKSCPLPAGTGRDEAARRGLVDAELPAASAGLAVRWVDFRQRPPGPGVVFE